MATTAVVVGAAAAVASAGVSAYGAASKGGKHGGGGPSLPETPLWEKLFNRGTGDLLDEERQVMQDSLAQANFLQPEMYKLLGFEPVYDDKQSADLKGLSDKSNAIKQQLGDTQAAIQSVRQAKGQQAKRAALQAAGVKNVAALERSRVNLLQQQKLADRQLGDAQALPRRVVGMKKLDQTANPTGNTTDDLLNMASDLTSQTLVRALKGEEPVDATLKTTFDEREAQLRERLRRTLGTDYESSSAGQQALANFDREKSESFKQFNQELIQSFSGNMAGVQSAIGTRMGQMLFPSSAQAQRGLLLGQVAADREAYVAQQQSGRELGFKASKAQYDAKVAEANARAEAIKGVGAALGNVGEGITSAGPTLGAALKSYMGSTTTAASGATLSSPDTSAASPYTLDYSSPIKAYLGR